jgi:signal recognition particle subunit SEC65
MVLICVKCIAGFCDKKKKLKRRFVLSRSLTSNPRLREIVDVVSKLNIAFQEDAGIPGTNIIQP